MSDHDDLTDDEHKVLSLFPLDRERLTNDEIAPGMKARFNLQWPPWTGSTKALNGLARAGYIVRVDLPAFDGWVLTPRGKATRKNMGDGEP
jgi:hypothetical protein